MSQVLVKIFGEKRGIYVLCNPQIYKSTTFTEAEREALGLAGPLRAWPVRIQVIATVSHLPCSCEKDR